MARGDVLLVDLPPPRGSAGHEQVGRRPAVAVQSHTADAQLPTLVVVPFTSKLKALRFSHCIEVAPSPANGLTEQSVLLVFQLRAVDKTRVRRTIGCLEQEYLDQLDGEIQRLLDL